MQKGRTLDFWDAFYENELRQAAHNVRYQQDRREDEGGDLSDNEQNENAATLPLHHTTKEWILQPSEAVLELLCRQLVSPRRRMGSIHDCVATERRERDRSGCGGSSSMMTIMRYIEIGAGTSCLSRAMFRYLLGNGRRDAGPRKNHVVENHHDDGHHLPGANQQQQRRLSALVTDVSAVCIEQNRQRDVSFLEEAGSSFRYSTLNIEAAPRSDLCRSFDFVLDKGCLDTFLFWTRHRGGRRKELLMKKVLDNLYMMLKTEAHCCLLILSPRSKMRPLREHPGFVCEKHKLDRAALGLAAADLSDGNKIGDRAAIYLYACRRRPGYDPSVAPPPPVPLPYTSCDGGLLCDDDACPSCAMTFLSFRGGHQSLEGRGKHVWLRQWTGHKAHCKGVVAR
jgi:hypothetical protein